VNEEIKKQWVTALIDGSYAQGKGCLRTLAVDGMLSAEADTFCCLGVLSDLYLKAHPDETGWDPDENDGKAFLQDGGGAFPPGSVIQWAELPELDNDPVIHVPGALFTIYPDLERTVMNRADHNRTRLSYLNDAGVPFTRIAELIEEQL
jgi:hypothetical protein